MRSEALPHHGKADSPVAENITGRGTLFELFRRDEAIRRMDALLLQLATNHALFLLTAIVDSVKMNQASPNSREYPIDRFALSAIELLITNRYLDQKDTFYENYRIRAPLLLSGQVVSLFYVWLNTSQAALETPSHAPCRTEITNCFSTGASSEYRDSESVV